MTNNCSRVRGLIPLSEAIHLKDHAGMPGTGSEKMPTRSGMELDRIDFESVGAISILLTRSIKAHDLTSTWRGIVRDPAGYSIILIPQKGRLRFFYKGTGIVIEPGRIAILREAVPHIGVDPSSDLDLDLLQIVVPTRILREHVPSEIGKLTVFDSPKPETALIENIYISVWQHNEEFSRDAAIELAHVGITLVGAVLQKSLNLCVDRLSIGELRYRQVREFIEQNLCDQDLSMAMISRACGLSKRYLSFLFSKHGTNFRELVWRSRLEAAKHWLCTSRSVEVTVAEVAYACGFKSPAHFCRTFKKTYKHNPSEVRLDSEIGFRVAMTARPSDSDTRYSSRRSPSLRVAA